MGPNSDVLENSTFFSKPVGPISHVFVGPNSYKSGGTRHVPPRECAWFIPATLVRAHVYSLIDQCKVGD